jgi:hypothetical protein
MTIPTQLAKLLTTALLALAPCALAGCLDTHNGLPESPRGADPQEPGVLRGPSGAAQPREWRQIIIGRPPDQTLRGYLRTADPHGYHWVYDRNFELVGHVTAQGATTRITVDGREIPSGSYRLDHAMLFLFGYEDANNEVVLARMPPPREY